MRPPYVVPARQGTSEIKYSRGDAPIGWLPVTANQNLCARLKPESGVVPSALSALGCEASDNRHNLRGSTVLIYRAAELGRALAGL
jgi:hypothetical protein